MKNFKEILLQSLLIFFSVFLGLVAGNWNEGKKQTKKAQLFLVQLSEELSNNRQSIERSIAYHQRLQVVSDSLLNHSTTAFRQMALADFGDLENLPAWQGLGISAIEQYVYESGVAAGVFQNLPMNLLAEIARIHSFQNEYIRFSRAVSDKLLNYSAETKLIEYIIILQLLGNDMLRMEEAMHQLYDQLLASMAEHFRENR